MPCPQYEHLLAKNLETDTYKAWRLKYKWLYSYIEDKSGKSLQKPRDIIHLHDTLKIELLSNKTYVYCILYIPRPIIIYKLSQIKQYLFRYSIPEWAAEKYDEIEKLSYFESRAHTGTRKMSRYTAGFLIKEIFERFTNRTKGPFMPDRRIWLYSGHDTNIASFLLALDTFTRVSV